jgi:large subunit ribosomal protein L24
MKFKVGDKVLVTAGKDRGKQGEIIQTLPDKNAVVVEGMNMYTRHIRPHAGQSGDKVRRERPLPTAKIAIINGQGQQDRIGYQVKNGKKERIFKKTGKVISDKLMKKGEKAAKKNKKETKKK